jgi:hypothetical protein
MSYNNGPKIVTNGLALALDAANNKSYPGTGNTWFDLSGNGNNCSFNSTPAWSNGEFTFNGTSHYGTITNNSSLDFSSEQTLMMVLLPTATSGRRNPWNQAYAGYGTWTWEGDGGKNITQFFGDGGADNLPYVGYTSIALATNELGIMTSTRNTSNQTWYKNTTVSTPTAHSYDTLTTTSANILIGFGYAGYFAGKINYVLAYTRALTTTEVLQNVNAIRSRFSI